MALTDTTIRTAKPRDREFKLADSAAAFARLESKHAHGKVLIEID